MEREPKFNPGSPPCDPEMERRAESLDGLRDELSVELCEIEISRLLKREWHFEIGEWVDAGTCIKVAMTAMHTFPPK